MPSPASLPLSKSPHRRDDLRLELLLLDRQSRLAWAQIVSILIGSPNTPAAVVTGHIANTTMDVTNVTSGTLVVGQTVVGSGIAAGTTITAFLDGSGSTGNYTVSQTQSVPGNVTISAVLPGLNDLTVNINQVPVIAAAQITTVLA